MIVFWSTIITIIKIGVLLGVTFDTIFSNVYFFFISYTSSDGKPTDKFRELNSVAWPNEYISHSNLVEEWLFVMFSKRRVDIPVYNNFLGKFMRFKYFEGYQYRSTFFSFLFFRPLVNESKFAVKLINYFVYVRL